ncbi:hypothetical protein [Streptomyces sp. NPDC059918]|uniref:hypothetical protein n=1 Tax=unclassified Streptomyces TaxID=2593676 RepID=UPI0036522A6C
MSETAPEYSAAEKTATESTEESVSDEQLIAMLVDRAHTVDDRPAPSSRRSSASGSAG